MDCKIDHLPEKAGWECDAGHGREWEDCFPVWGLLVEVSEYVITY